VQLAILTLYLRSKYRVTVSNVLPLRRFFISQVKITTMHFLYDGRIFLLLPGAGHFVMSPGTGCTFCSG